MALSYVCRWLEPKQPPVFYCLLCVALSHYYISLYILRPSNILLIDLLVDGMNTLGTVKVLNGCYLVETGARKYQRTPHGRTLHAMEPLSLGFRLDEGPLRRMMCFLLADNLRNISAELPRTCSENLA